MAICAMSGLPSDSRDMEVVNLSTQPSAAKFVYNLSSSLHVSRISGSQSGGYVEYYLLRYNSV
jgi:hypothetical protein